MAKIVLISNKDNNFYNFRSELILELKNIGYDVLLVCPYGKKIDYFTEKGCRFENIDVDRRGKSIFKDLNLINAYKKLLKREKPEIVLTYTTKSSIYAGYVCGKLGIPYIVNNAGLITASGLFKIFMNYLYKKGFKKANCMMFQNEFEMNYLEKILKWKVPHKLIPGSGVNLNKFSPMEYPNDDSKIIFNFVARIVEFKGINEYIECAKNIHSKYPNTVFRIFGDFDDDNYRDIIHKLHDEKIVEYMGVVIDMKPWIAECHAAIHPSHYEGMTNVVLEHSSMGRPCIGSNIPGVKEGIEDGKTGFLFEVKNTNSLIEKVEKFILLSNEQKKQMGLDARNKMVNQFDRNIITDAYIKEIKGILKE